MRWFLILRILSFLHQFAIRLVIFLCQQRLQVDVGLSAFHVDKYAFLSLHLAHYDPQMLVPCLLELLEQSLRGDPEEREDFGRPEQLILNDFSAEPFQILCELD